MPEVEIRVRISQRHFLEYQAEARRQGVPVERLIEQTVNCLLAELDSAVVDCDEIEALPP